MILFEDRNNDLGVVRLEKWPEGYVLWCGGEIAWRSWRKTTEVTVLLKVDASAALDTIESAITSGAPKPIMDMEKLAVWGRVARPGRTEPYQTTPDGWPIAPAKTFSKVYPNGLPDIRWSPVIGMKRVV